MYVYMYVCMENHTISHHIHTSITAKIVFFFFIYLFIFCIFKRKSVSMTHNTPHHTTHRTSCPSPHYPNLKANPNPNPNLNPNPNPNPNPNTLTLTISLMLDWKVKIPT